MKKLIKLSNTHYVVVDDSEIKEGDGYYTPKDGVYMMEYGICNSISKIKDAIKLTGKPFYRIIHSTQPLETKNEEYAWYGGENKTTTKTFDKIKQLSLSEVEEAINGYSVENLAKKILGEDLFTKGHRIGFVIGFNAHKELLKDENKEVIELLTNITEWSSFKEHPIGKQAQRALELLTVKTKWDVEIIDGKIKLIQ